MPDIDGLDAVPDRSAPNQESAGWAAVGGLGAVLGTQLTAGSANVKGSWTQLIASTAKRAIGLVVSIDTPASTAKYLVDIGIGASGSETVLISDLFFFRASTTGLEAACLYFPVTIPAGTRVAARCQSSTGAATVYVAVSLMELD